jgi:hypothetical protein
VELSVAEVIGAGVVMLSVEFAVCVREPAVPVTVIVASPGFALEEAAKLIC